MNKIKICFISGLSIVGCLTLFCLPALAVEVNSSILPFLLYNDKLELQSQANIIDANFKGMTDFSFIDLGSDGVPEVVASFGYQEKPMVKIMRLDGSLIKEWQPYGPGFQGRISIATADFDFDKQVEIVTSPGESGGPHIQIFDSFGVLKYNKGFFADDEINRQGTEVATGDINGNGNNEIIVTLIGEKSNLIKIFDQTGRQLYNTIEVAGQQFFEPLKVATFDLNGDNQDEIIVGASIGNKPEVKVFNYLGDELLSFEAYAGNFTGGVDVSAGNFSGVPLIVTAAGYSGGPHVRFFNWEKTAVINTKFFPYDQTFRGGVNVATFQGADKLYLGFLPQTINFKSQLTSFGKVIKVDISEQKLYAYDKGRMVKSFLVSTGKRGFDTPYGQFSVYRKTPIARMSWNYGLNNPYNYDLPNVPHILAFSGPFTIHGAYWHHNWGYRMSHGCVNVSLPMAKWLYNWAPVGTAVVIEP